MNIDRRSFITLAAAGLVPWDALQPQPAGRTGAGGGTVAIRIYGLTALTMQGNKLAVIMPDAVNAGLTTPHEPRLYASPASMATGSEPPTGTEGKLAFWALRGYRVRIAGSSAAGVTNHRPPRAKTAADHKPDPSTDGDVGWVASMDRIRTKHALRADLAHDEGDAPELVASQAFFTDGELKSTFPTSSTNWKNIEWKFDPAPSLGAYQQALGDATLVKPVSSSTVTFTLSPFKGGAPKSIILKVGSPLDVLLQNGSTTHTCKDPEEKTLSHFAAYYALVESSSETNKPVPVFVPGSEAIACGGTMDELIRCPPMRY